MNRPQQLHLLPPGPGVCQTCAVDHEAELPHDNTSMFYQISFHLKHGRYPTWEDAMAHCTDEMKADWTRALEDYMKGQSDDERPSEPAGTREAGDH